MKETVLHIKRSAAPLCDQRWIGWAPLVVLTTVAVYVRRYFLPWEQMWILSIVVFVGFKWWTWWRVSDGVNTTYSRSIAYLFLWPGMDSRRFFSLKERVEWPRFVSWFWAFTKTAFGALLIWGVARWAGNGLLAAWIGMVGFIFLLHFGLFDLLSLFWRRNGVCAPPLMNCPIAAVSMSDFWGRRWNSGFRDIVFGLMFLRLAKRVGTTAATIATFVISGLIHELVITIPAGAGYGLPTFYFTIQGVGMLLEHSPIGAKFGLAGGLRGHLFTLCVVTLPIFALFPPVFVLRVMLPFFQVIQALP